MNHNQPFRDGPHLTERLRHARELVFLVGSGLTMPRSEGGPGVWGTPTLVAELTKRLEKQQGRPPSVPAPNSQPYQHYFAMAEEALGSHGTAKIIREAVLHSYGSSLDRKKRTKIIEGDPHSCQELEEQTKDWFISSGAMSLGWIVASHRAPVTVLTTNFDPQMWMAVRRAGARAVTSVLDVDGWLMHTRAFGPHIVHLHGYWYGADMLHTVAQLNADHREKLVGSIDEVLRGKQVCVLGYGGWQDVFREALKRSLNSRNPPELHWCFRSSEPQARANNSELLAEIRSKSTHFYADIDCDKFLPSLQESMKRSQVVVGGVDEDDASTEQLKAMLAERDERIAELEAGSPSLLAQIDGKLETIANQITVIKSIETSVASIDEKAVGINSALGGLSGKFRGAITLGVFLSLATLLVLILAGFKIGWS